MQYFIDMTLDLRAMEKYSVFMSALKRYDGNTVTNLLNFKDVSLADIMTNSKYDIVNSIYLWAQAAVESESVISDQFATSILD
eukprot:UN27133